LSPKQLAHRPTLGSLFEKVRTSRMLIPLDKAKKVDKVDIDAKEYKS